MLKFPNMVVYKKKLLIVLMLTLQCFSRTFCQVFPDYFQPLEFNPSLAGTTGGRCSFNYSTVLSRFNSNGEIFSNTFSYDQMIGQSKSGIGVLYNYSSDFLLTEKSIGLIFCHSFKFKDLIIKPAIELESIKTKYDTYQNIFIVSESRNEFGFHASLIAMYHSLRTAIVLPRINRPLLTNFGNPNYNVKSPLSFFIYNALIIKLSDSGEGIYLMPELGYMHKESAITNYDFVSLGFHLRLHKFTNGIQINLFKRDGNEFIYSIAYRTKYIEPGIAYLLIEPSHLLYNSTTVLNFFCRFKFNQKEEEKMSYLY